jgi:PAS domain S-box-containing protein
MYGSVPVTSWDWVKVAVRLVDGQFFEVNPALAAMLGYDSPNEVVKLNTANLYADQEERSRLVQKWLETERIEDEVNWNRRSGEIIRVRLSGRTLTDRHGIVQGFEFIAEDGTERRALEAQLRAKPPLFTVLTELTAQKELRTLGSSAATRAGYVGPALPRANCDFGDSPRGFFHPTVRVVNRKHTSGGSALSLATTLPHVS